MEPKPAHLGPQYGAQFQDGSVEEVAALVAPHATNGLLTLQIFATVVWGR